MFTLTVVILTYNEQVHIERAIKNVLDFADKIIVLDSCSQDETVNIANSLGAEVIFRKFDNYKKQRQYAIEFCKKITKWMLFLDADEYLLPELKKEIIETLQHSDNTAGYYLNRRAIFMNRWIKYGGYYPSYLLRLFRPEVAAVDGEINEHILVNGMTKNLKYDFVDHSLKNIEFWIDKHNRYTNGEAYHLWLNKKNKLWCDIKLNKKKWIKKNIWNRLPLLLRPIFYFIYRYFFRFGFLDGKEGFIYHVLQGGWLWFVVDVKYLEMNRCWDERK